MEVDDDDMIVVIVGDETEQDGSDFQTNIIKNPEEIGALGIEELIETAEKHGEVVPIEFEIKDELNEYLDEELVQDSSEEIADDDCKGLKEKSQRHTMLKPNQCWSYINELRQQYPELKEDRDLLIATVCEIMLSVSPPPPPEDYFVINDSMFECTKCEAVTQTEPAAARHYQEKHGPRYLVCFACGVDFRSKTNLYKHEKRCHSPDATIMLKARAIFVGRKGRSRPFLAKNTKMSKYIESATKMSSKRYQCHQCPAAFAYSTTLESHMHLHSGSRPYQCDQCPAAYTSKSALTKHTHIHMDLEYICDHCKRSFRTKPVLISHMNTHSPLRKYPCEICGRRYAQKTALTLHINKKHLNLPPPFACQFCPKRYPKMSLLKQHMKNAHGMSLITRNMFFKKLPTLTETDLNDAIIVYKSDLAATDDNVRTTCEDNNAEEHFKIEVELQGLTKTEHENKRNEAKSIVIQNGEIVNSDQISIKEEPFRDDFKVEQDADLIEELQCNDGPNSVTMEKLNTISAEKLRNANNKQKNKSRRKSQETIQYCDITPMDGLDL